jgi:cell division topological specificity factor
MPSLLDRLMNKSASANTAKQRLHLVLIHDRANLPAGQMEMMKDELIRVISKYVDIDKSNAEIAVENEGREQRLIMNIPFIKEKQKKYS